MNFPDALLELIENFNKLPGIGKKSAQRLAFSLLDGNAAQIGSFIQSLDRVRLEIKPCPKCFAYTDLNICSMCSNPKRNSQQICVVEKQSDIIAFERGGVYKGLYHVLGGSLSPLDGIGPKELNLPVLFHRITEQKVEEIILATSASPDGEATATYIDQSLADKNIKRTRLARGIPMGTEFEFLDELTLSRALESRTSM